MKWCDLTRDGFGDLSIKVSPSSWQNAIRRWPVWKWTLHRYFRFSLDDSALESKLVSSSTAGSENESARVHYLMAVHPHGLFSISTLLGFILPSPAQFGPTLEELPTTFVHPILLSIPVVRELFLLVGCRSATREVMKARLLQRSATVNLVSVVVPGGIKELVYPDMYTSLDDNSSGKWSEKAALRQNWGFLKLAYETGAIVVPCYCSSESLLFRTWSSGWESLRVFMYRHVGYPFPTFFWGPLRPTAPEGLRLIVGRPIRPRPFNAATQEEDIAALKNEYFQALCCMRSTRTKAD